jgi:hypothetical protein
MMANSQVTTILLLVAIGAILYWMNQPSQVTTEGLEDVAAPSETVEEPVAAEVAAPVAAPAVVEDVAASVEKEAELPEVEVPKVAEESDVSGMSGEGGAASLDAAFMGAVPPNTAVDQVDFNRNNVTEYDSAQYLPKEVNDEWFDTDFTQAKYNLNDDKMINTNRYMIGVNTVGQSLKNPAYDIRGTIPNPKYTVSPWNNSTYEPDNNLKPLC